MNDILREDLEFVINDENIIWEKLKNTTFLISGATGLICSTLIKALLHADIGIEIYAIVRNREKATDIFGESENLYYIVGDVTETVRLDIHYDYIVHGASPTASEYFINNPLETIKAGVIGTLNLIDIAKNNGTTAFLYLSSMEAYGEVKNEEKLNEKMLGFLQLQNIRNCYPETKRMSEAICVAASAEYGIRTIALRLAQTFGPGVSLEDKRVFAMMARCAMNYKDIVLQTRGLSRHPYLYTAEAVTAILTLLTKGEAGKIYNAANPETYCSIYEMGEMVADKLANGRIKVYVKENGETAKYPSPSFLNLDTTEIESLGWKATMPLENMFRRMMQVMK